MEADVKRYATPGTADVYICLPYQKPEGAVEVTGTCPGYGYIVDESGTWIRDPSIPYGPLRQQDILNQWPVHLQLEAITEQLAGRPAKFDKLMADIGTIKEKFPKS